MKTVNLGILAHVDAGKTSLTERLLFETGVIGELGSVDGGTTRTDTMELERRRGITIRSAVVSFTVDDLTVNLIDTPGHSDFIAEVERALSVLDGAVLVVSAVEGVQVQTRILMRTLARLKIPTLVFVNKIDRMGARYEDLLESITAKLTPSTIALQTVSDLGNWPARVHSRSLEDVRFFESVVEVLAGNDDAFLADYLAEDVVVDAARVRRELVTQVGKAQLTPVFFGSAMSGEGVGELIRAIRELLPPGDTGQDALSGSVFKIERGFSGEKIAYVRVFAGSLGIREQVSFFRDGESEERTAKVTGLRVFEQGEAVPTQRVAAGRIAQVWGLDDVRIGDRLGLPGGTTSGSYFLPPAFETVVRAADPAEEPRLYPALRTLSEQDPLIHVRRGEYEISVSLYGEVQQEVLKSQLESEFGVHVVFDETQVVHREKPVGTGEALEVILEDGNPFYATVGLRVEPGAPDSGVGYRLDVELGGLPRAFHTAIEQTVRQELRHGNFGWEVTDCVITLTHTGYASPVTAAADFRKLTALVLATALRRAGTRVYEPVERFELEVPPDTIATVCAKLGEAGAAVRVGDGRLEGVIPARTVHAFERQLPGMTQGEGVFLSRFEGYHPSVTDPVRRSPGR
ncbi:MAG: GTP-binding protein [Amycolatopsis sp.]|uniref:elongation factor G n=1 Tax=Amycolatopsis sp. TaxID=37632 RepID=UPI00261C98E6|nr:TetM/TetW/TetO/TetS family tetracycline resistance ribosomal protection protein [Amycolatopsis sp.]MCU1686478.1 GTP-binding protein [Amycolatopsis sp.]